MRNFFVPQSTQTARVGVWPFFMVTASMSRDAVLGVALHAENPDPCGGKGYWQRLQGQNGGHRNPWRREAAGRVGL